MSYNWKDIQIYYNDGHSLEECYSKFGFHRTAINHAEKVGKFERRKQDKAKRYSNWIEILDYYLAGNSLRKCQIKFGPNPSSIISAAKRLNVKIRVAKRYNLAEIQEYYDKGFSFKDCHEKFGISKMQLSTLTKLGRFKARSFVKFHHSEKTK